MGPWAPCSPRSDAIRCAPAHVHFIVSAPGYQERHYARVRGGRSYLIPMRYSASTERLIVPFVSSWTTCRAAERLGLTNPFSHRGNTTSSVRVAVAQPTLLGDQNIAMPTPSPRWDRDYEWKAVTLLALGFGLVGLDRWIIAPLFPFMAKDLGLDYQAIGNVVGVLGMVWGVFAVVSGRLSDWVGHRKVLVPAVLLAFR